MTINQWMVRVAQALALTLFATAGLAQEIRNQVKIQFLSIETSDDPLRFRVLNQDYLDPDLASYDADTEGDGARLSDTWWFTTWFGVEVGASYLGQYSTRIDASDHPYKVVSRLYSGQVGPSVRWQFFKKLEVFSRLSLSYWREESELFDLQPGMDESGQTPFVERLNRRHNNDVETEWEAGLTLDISDLLGLTASVIRGKSGEMDLDMIAVGLSYRY